MQPPPAESPAKIADQTQAGEFARAIWSDVMLYYADKVQGQPPERITEILRDELAESRALFQSRVTAELRGIFDEYFPMFLRSQAHRLQFKSAASAQFFASILLEEAAREPSPNTIDDARGHYRSHVPEGFHAAFEATLIQLGLPTR